MLVKRGYFDPLSARLGPLKSALAKLGPAAAWAAEATATGGPDPESRRADGEAVSK